MAFQHARTAGFCIRDSSTTFRNITAYCNSVELSRESETAETTVFNSSNGSKTYVPGLKDATLSAGGPWDPTVDNYLNGIVGKSKLCNYFPATTDKTNTQFVHYKANMICTSYSPPASVSDANTWSAEWQVTGSVTRTTTTG